MNQPGTETALTQFNVTDAAIAEMAEMYLPLTVKGVEDREGLLAVHNARMKVKRTRVDVDNTRKALIRGALDFQNAVNGEAKRIAALLEPIESHLQSEEDAVKAEKERIKREAEEAAREALRKRMELLAAVRSHLLPVDVEGMDEEEFAAALEGATAAHRERLEDERIAREKAEAAEKERKRLAAEEEKRLAAERERLEADRRRMAEEQAERDRVAAEARAREQAELDRQRAENEAERRRLEAAEAERQRLEAEAKAKAEADARAKREAEEREARERAEAEAAAKAEEERLARVEALKPDYHKVGDFLQKLAAMKAEIPDVACSEEIHKALKSSLVTITAIANRLAHGEVS